MTVENEAANVVQHLPFLAVGATAGAIQRALTSSKPTWTQRISVAASGALSAIGLGYAVGSVVQVYLPTLPEGAAFVGSAYLCGVSGETITSFLIRKISDKKG